MTRNELVARATRHARKGASAAESGIFDDNAQLLVPNAMEWLARTVAADAMLRPRLQKEYTTPINNGVVDVATDMPDTLMWAMGWSSFYDGDDVDRVNPYIWKDNYQQLDRYLNPMYGYYATKGSSQIVTRQRGVMAIPDGKIGTPGPNVIIIASYIPASDLTNLPSELDDMAIEGLATLLLATPGEM